MIPPINKYIALLMILKHVYKWLSQADVEDLDRIRKEANHAAIERRDPRIFERALRGLRDNESDSGPHDNREKETASNS